MTVGVSHGVPCRRSGSAAMALPARPTTTAATIAPIAVVNLIGLSGPECACARLLDMRTSVRISAGLYHMTSPRPALRPSREREFVQGLERGFAVIKAFNARLPQLTVTQVAARTGLTRAVARRYLLTLETLGYIIREDNVYTLSPRVLDLGFTYLSTLCVADVALPFMRRIVDQFQESCSVAVLDAADIVYVARVFADRIMTTNLLVGSRLPAHATAMGKILLAFETPSRLDAYFAAADRRAMTARTICRETALRRELLDVKRRGWASNDEESEKGVRTVAAPILDRTGRVVAAINLSGHSSRVSMRELKGGHLKVLLATANDISSALGAGSALQRASA
jgi:IclR family pca regulon transcriptional regulator